MSNQDLSKDVPILNWVQFSGLHMALSMNGFDYSFAREDEVKEKLNTGWCVIARGDDGSYIFLKEPVVEEEDDEDNDKYGKGNTW